MASYRHTSVVPGQRAGNPRWACPSSDRHAKLGRHAPMALLRRIIGSRLVRYGFVAVTVGLGGYAVVRDWHSIGPALGRIGLPVSLASLAITLLALIASMWTWRVLLAGLGSPLSFGVAARVMLVGQLGK